MSDTIDSEEQIIQRYFAPLAKSSPGSLGLMDDCALIQVASGEELVVTVDAVAAGVHFLRNSAPADVAWKALAVNVSDLAGKGAKPLAYVMSIAMPEAPKRQWLEQFCAGLQAAQDAFGIALIGGDTDRRPGPLSITITAFGAVPKGAMIQRSTARAGDRIFVSGTIGDAALGLKLEQTPALAGTWGLDAAEATHLRRRYARPQPRLGLRDALRHCASAAMDVSDGLAKDLERMLNAGGVGGRIHAGDVPLSAAARKAVERDASLWERILTGGDDYEVLATVDASQSTRFVELAINSGISVAEIGCAESGIGLKIESPSGELLSMSRSGWDHFPSGGE